MRRSEARQKVQAWAQQEDTLLLASDPRLQHAVRVVHQDGSDLFFDGAFVEVCGEDKVWFIVFTEHHGFLVYHKDDATYSEWRRRAGRRPGSR